MSRVSTGLLALALLAGGARAEPSTPNELLAGGPPTFVAGTLGDDDADREVMAQITLIRDMLFPKSSIVADTSIDVAKGPAAWPPRPVLYGGPHVNAVVAALAPRLPFSMERGKLVLGERTFAGDDARLIALVPGRPAADGAPAFPPFLLYAGCGMPGVAEINAVNHGADGFLVLDRFGPAFDGAFLWGDDGWFVAHGTNRRRIEWRERRLAAPDGGGTVSAFRPAMIAESPREAAEDARLLAACARIWRGLGLSKPLALAFYVYPDRRSKASLTGNGGDGHMDALSRTLHVVAGDNDGFEGLATHEGTHAAALATYGLAGTAAMGEGLAVDVSGSYGGVALAEWKAKLPADPPPLAAFLGGAFRELPEPVAYPAAGLLVRALRAKLGPAFFTARLYQSPARDFEAACAKAGLPAADLAALYRSALAR